jgi:hypothetical protein
VQTQSQTLTLSRPQPQPAAARLNEPRTILSFKTVSSLKSTNNSPVQLSKEKKKPKLSLVKKTTLELNETPSKSMVKTGSQSNLLLKTPTSQSVQQLKPSP